MAKEDKDRRGSVGGPAWRSILTPRYGRRRLGDYSVKGPWQDRVIAVARQEGELLASETFDGSSGSMGSYTIFRLGDGSCLSISGVGRPIQGWANGLWINGRLAMQFMLSTLSVEPPMGRSRRGDVVDIHSEVEARHAARPREEELLSASRDGYSDRAKELVREGVPVDAGYGCGYTPLLYSASRGDFELATFLLEHGANPSAICYSFPPWLVAHRDAAQIAVDNGHMSVLEALALRQSKRVSQKDLENCCTRARITVLVVALEAGDKARAEELFDQGVEADGLLPLTLSQYTPLGIAVMNGHAACCESLILHGANPDRQIGAGEDTPLLTAIRRGDCLVVDALLGAGASIDHPSRRSEYDRKWGPQEERRTPMEVAVETGDSSIVELLLRHAPRLSGLDKCLKYAQEVGLTGIADLFVQTGVVDPTERKQRQVLMHRRWHSIPTAPECRPLLATCEGILLASRNRDTVTVRELLEKGTSPNLSDPGGRTPLMLAVCPGLTVPPRPSPGAFGQYGKRTQDWDRRYQAIHKDLRARRSRVSLLARILIDAGAEQDLEDSAGWTALMYALACGNVTTARVLLRGGADPTKISADGLNTLLVVGCFGGAHRSHAALVELLVREGVPVDHACQGGLTALMAYARIGAENSVRKVLDAGASPDTADEHGVSALMEAVTGGSQRVARLLLKRGADSQARAALGFTALTLARDKASDPSNDALVSLLERERA
jgi:ankyrin repeat protein